MVNFTLLWCWVILKLLIFILFSDNHPGVIHIAAPELLGMWSLRNSFLLEFLNEEVREDQQEGRPHSHAIGLLTDPTIEPEVCHVHYHLK